jgi:hypothetical protein
MWENEFVRFLIDDINRGTKFLENVKNHSHTAETRQERMIREYQCACDYLKLAVGNLHSLGMRMNHVVVNRNK